MRLCVVLLALSTLAATGPLPPSSNAGLVACASPSIPANYTLGSDSIAALAQLKAVYDSLNQNEPSSTLKVKRNFWQWIKDAFEAPGLKARSPVPTSLPDENPLDSNPLAPFTKLEAVYDSLYGKRMENGAMAKRDFWQWLKDAFEAPGLKARSSVPISTRSDNSSDPIATLTKLKAVYESLNGKRTENGAKAKRDFWQWIKDAFEAPGLKARSSVPTSTPGDNSSNPIATLTKLKAVYESLNEKRTDSGVEAKSSSWKWLKDTCEQGPKTRSLDDHSPIYSDSVDACTARE